MDYMEREAENLETLEPHEDKHYWSRLNLLVLWAWKTTIFGLLEMYFLPSIIHS